MTCPVQTFEHLPFNLAQMTRLVLRDPVVNYDRKEKRQGSKGCKAGTIHVDGDGVLLGAVEQLWRPVPQRHHLVGR